MHKKGHKLKNSPLVKNPQFSSNLADIQAKLPTHEAIILTKFHKEWKKCWFFYLNKKFWPVPLFMHHPLLGWMEKSLCNHAVPYNILTYLNNHANSQCLVNYVCPRTVTADDLAPFHSKNPDEKRVNPCIRKLASIPAVVSQNVTYKSCLVCIRV